MKRRSTPKKKSKLIGLHDSDAGKIAPFPNLVLMKLSAFHKKKGDTVEWFTPMKADMYDTIYASKVFTYTKKDKMHAYLEKLDTTQFGGSGYKMYDVDLSGEVEHICPDYSLYGVTESYGFLTRGCPNKCSWCVVPTKEGKIRGHADIKEFARTQEVILMDNNPLACDWGLQQIEKMGKMGLKIDFNQGLDARIIAKDKKIAKLLASCKWLRPVRLACDHPSQMKHVEKAVYNLREAGCTPSTYFCYVLTKDIPDALERVEFLRGLKVDPYTQIYRDFDNTYKPSREQKKFARWVNEKKFFKAMTWEQFKERELK